MWNSVWKSGNFHMVFTFFTLISHEIPHACEDLPCERCVKTMWKRVWKMLSFSQSVSHTLADKFTHQTCEIPCEMVVTFTQYSYVFHMIISHACEILQCEWHVKRMWMMSKSYLFTQCFTWSENKGRQAFIILVWNFLGYYQCYTRSWHPT